MKAKSANYFARGFVATIIAILVLVVIGFFRYASAADGLAVTYVPKNVAAEDMYVPLDLVVPGKRAPAQVQALMAELKKELDNDMEPEPDGYNREYTGKCEVMVLLERRSKKDPNPEPYFRLECASAPLWAGDKGLHPPVAVLKTTIEVVVVLKSFSRTHFARVSDSIVRQTVKYRTLGS